MQSSARSIDCKARPKLYHSSRLSITASVTQQRYKLCCYDIRQLSFVGEPVMLRVVLLCSSFVLCAGNGRMFGPSYNFCFRLPTNRRSSMTFVAISALTETQHTSLLASVAMYVASTHSTCLLSMHLQRPASEQYQR